jgi:hypothetical protein
MKLITRGPVILLVLFSMLVLGVLAAAHVLMGGVISVACRAVSIFTELLGEALEAISEYWGKP